VLPISYRLIVFDTALLVKKSLNILNQNGMHVGYAMKGRRELTAVRRHRLSAAMGLQIVHIRRTSHNIRLYQCHTILLAEPRCSGPRRPVPLEQP
jgi:hypothetical protein